MKRFPPASKKRLKRLILTKALDIAEDFFVWLFRQRHPNASRRNKPKDPPQGFGGGGASMEL